jgi:hypothetical protein
VALTWPASVRACRGAAQRAEHRAVFVPARPWQLVPAPAHTWPVAAGRCRRRSGWRGCRSCCPGAAAGRRLPGSGRWPRPLRGS